MLTVMQLPFVLSYENSCLGEFDQRISHRPQKHSLDVHLKSIQDIYSQLEMEQQQLGGQPEIVKLWLKDWTSGEDKLQKVLRQWEVVENNPETPDALPLLAWLATRRRRWELLCVESGIPFPDVFLLYRIDRLWRKGYLGERVGQLVEVVKVLKDIMIRWELEPDGVYSPRKTRLASWSLSPDGYQYDSVFALRYQASIPFIDTFADKWVDDSAFLACQDEDEVIVSGDPEVLIQNVEVEVNHQRFTYQQKDELKHAANLILIPFGLQL
ncbi:MAG: hypothetical protein RLZZ156_1345 [Deinococcota bacterium]